MKNKAATLEEYVKKMSGGRGAKRFDILEKVYSDVINKKIVLVDPNPPKDFLEYLVRPDYSLWLWVVLILSLLTVLTIALSSVIQFLYYIRFVLGSIIVLFTPGYVTVEALYPREQELSSLEKLALSIGLSLALVPLIGLLLNYTPWGIRLGPVLTSIVVYVVSIGFIASYRKYQILKQS